LEIRKENRKFAFSDRELKKNIGNCLFLFGNRKRKSEFHVFSSGIEKESRNLTISDRKSEKNIGILHFPIFFLNSRSENAKFRLSFSISNEKKTIPDILFQFPTRKSQLPISAQKKECTF